MANDEASNRLEQARMELRALVREGMESGEGSELNSGYFENLRKRIAKTNPSDF